MNYNGNVSDWHQYNITSSNVPEVTSSHPNVNPGHYGFVPNVNQSSINSFNHNSNTLEKHQNLSHSNPRHFQTTNDVTNRFNGSGKTLHTPATQMPNYIGHYNIQNPRYPVDKTFYGTGTEARTTSFPYFAEERYRNTQIPLTNSIAHLNRTKLNINNPGATINQQRSIPTTTGRQNSSINPCKGICCNTDSHNVTQHWEKTGTYPANSYRDTIPTTGYQVDNDLNYRKEISDNKEVTNPVVTNADQRKNLIDYKYNKDSIIPRNFTSSSRVLPNCSIQNYNYTGDYSKYPYPVQDYSKIQNQINSLNQASTKTQEQNYITQQKYNCRQNQYQTEQAKLTKPSTPPNISNNVNQSVQNPYFGTQYVKSAIPEFQQKFQETNDASTLLTHRPQPLSVYDGHSKYQIYQQKIAMQRYSLECHLEEFMRIPGYQSHPKYKECILQYRELVKVQQSFGYQNNTANQVPTSTSTNSTVPSINLQFDQNGALINTNYPTNGFPRTQQHVVNSSSQLEHTSTQRTESNVSNLSVPKEQNIQQYPQLVGNPSQNENSDRQSLYMIPKPSEQHRVKEQSKENESTVTDLSNNGKTNEGTKSNKELNKPELDVRQFLANWDESEDEENPNANLPDVVLSNTTPILIVDYENVNIPEKVVGNIINSKENNFYINETPTENVDKNVIQTSTENCLTLAFPSAEENPVDSSQICTVETDYRDIVKSGGIIQCIRNSTDQIPTIHIVENLELPNESVIKVAKSTEPVSMFYDEKSKTEAQSNEDSCKKIKNPEPRENIVDPSEENSKLEGSKNTTTDSNESLKKQSNYVIEESHNPDDISLPDLQTSECTPISTTLNTPTQSDTEESSEQTENLTISTNPIEIIHNSPMISFTHSPIRNEPYDNIDNGQNTKTIPENSLEYNFQEENNLSFDNDKFKEQVSSNNDCCSNKEKKDEGINGIENKENKEQDPTVEDNEKNTSTTNLEEADIWTNMAYKYDSTVETITSNRCENKSNNVINSTCDCVCSNNCKKMEKITSPRFDTTIDFSEQTSPLDVSMKNTKEIEKKSNVVKHQYQSVITKLIEPRKDHNSSTNLIKSTKGDFEIQLTNVNLKIKDKDTRTDLFELDENDGKNERDGIEIKINLSKSERNYNENSTNVHDTGQVHVSIHNGAKLSSNVIVIPNETASSIETSKSDDPQDCKCKNLDSSKVSIVYIEPEEKKPSKQLIKFNEIEIVPQKTSTQRLKSKLNELLERKMKLKASKGNQLVERKKKVSWSNPSCEIKQVDKIDESNIPKKIEESIVSATTTTTTTIATTTTKEHLSENKSKETSKESVIDPKRTATITENSELEESDFHGEQSSGYVNPIFTNANEIKNFHKVPVYTTKDGKITYSPSPKFIYRTLIREAQKKKNLHNFSKYYNNLHYRKLLENKSLYNVNAKSKISKHCQNEERKNDKVEADKNSWNPKKKYKTKICPNPIGETNSELEFTDNNGIINPLTLSNDLLSKSTQESQEETNNNKLIDVELSKNLPENEKIIDVDVNKDEIVESDTPEVIFKCNKGKKMKYSSSNELQNIEEQISTSNDRIEECGKTNDQDSTIFDNNEIKIVPKLVIKTSESHSKSIPSPTSDSYRKIPKMIIRNVKSRPGTPTIEEITDDTVCDSNNGKIVSNTDEKIPTMKIKIEDLTRSVPRVRIKSLDITKFPNFVHRSSITNDTDDTSNSSVSSITSTLLKKKRTHDEAKVSLKRLKKSEKEESTKCEVNKKKDRSLNSIKIPKVVIKRTSASAEFKCEFLKDGKKQSVRSAKWQPEVKLERSQVLDRMVKELNGTRFKVDEERLKINENNEIRNVLSRSCSTSDLFKSPQKQRRLSDYTCDKNINSPESTNECLLDRVNRWRTTDITIKTKNPDPVSNDSTTNEKKVHSITEFESKRTFHFKKQMLLDTLFGYSSNENSQIDDGLNYSNKIDEEKMNEGNEKKNVINFEEATDESGLIKVESSDESQGTIELLPASPGIDQNEMKIENLDGETLYSEDAIPTQFELELDIADQNSVDLRDMPNIVSPKTEFPNLCYNNDNISKELFSNDSVHVEPLSFENLHSIIDNNEKRVKTLNHKNENNKKSITNEDSICCNEILVKDILAAKETLKKYLPLTSKDNKTNKQGKLKSSIEKKQGSSLNLNIYKNRMKKLSPRNKISDDHERNVEIQRNVKQKIERESNSDKYEKQHSKQERNNLINGKNVATISLKDFKRLGKFNAVEQRIEHKFDKKLLKIERFDDIVEGRTDNVRHPNPGGKEKDDKKEIRVKEDPMPILEPQVAFNFDPHSDRDSSRSPPVITNQDGIALHHLDQTKNSKDMLTSNDKALKREHESEMTLSDIITQLAYHEKATIRHKRYCALCEKWFPSTARHHRHLTGYQHRHTELTQRRTIHALFMLFTGKPCAKLPPANVRRNDCTPGELTPLQIAVQDVAMCLKYSDEEYLKKTKVDK